MAEYTDEIELDSQEFEMPKYPPLMKLREKKLFVKYIKQVKSKKAYLEIGVFRGGSLSLAILNAPDNMLAFIGIDPMNPSKLALLSNGMNFTKHPSWVVFANIDDCRKRRDIPPVIIYPERSVYVDINSYPMKSLKGKVGFLLIDGAHEYDAIVLDGKFIDLVCKGGIVAFHDYGALHTPHSKEAADAVVVEKNLKFLEHIERLAIFKKN